MAAWLIAQALFVLLPVVTLHHTPPGQEPYQHRIHMATSTNQILLTPEETDPEKNVGPAEENFNQ
eukprot:3095790-Amphidinium_carterae.2